MDVRRIALPAALVVAGLGLWLLLAGFENLLGFDAGAIGFALLMLSAWTALYAVSRLPRGAAELAVSPGEWKAWIGTAFMAIAVAYFLAKVHVFQTTSLLDNPDASAVGRNLVLLLVAWTILSSLIGARWKDRVQADERDLQIARHASGWGRAALTTSLIGLALCLGFSPADRLQWATLPMIANLLILALMVGYLFEYAASATLHWLDRR
jgi:hypothetical protein